MQLTDLPDEVVARVFSYVLPNVLHDKFLPSKSWDTLSGLQLLAYKSIVSGTIIVRGGNHTNKMDSVGLFHTQTELKSAFTIKTMERGYDTIRDLIMYNMKSQTPVLPVELGLYYRSDGHETEEYVVSELRAMVKILELLAVGYLLAIPVVNVQLEHNADPSPTLKSLRRKVTNRMLALDKRLCKVLFAREFAASPFYDHLQFMSSRFENLKQIHFWNDGIRDISLPRVASCAPNLQVLDLSGNSISNLVRVPVSESITVLRVRANGLTSLEGLEFKSCGSLRVLDASVNDIGSLEGVFLPPSIRNLDVSFNAIAKVGLIMLPANLETLKLSKNSILSLTHLELPQSLQKLQLDSNNITALPIDFFHHSHKLTVLDLSDNKIDDLDELGQLPDSLQHLKLDGNQIDYSNLSNILQPNLRTLSMASTGLVSLTHLNFPPYLSDINFSKNEISELAHIKFGPHLAKLDLSYNRLESYNPAQQKLDIPATAMVILEHNSLKDEVEK